MAEGIEHVELKFRIYDGTDISHGSYASSTTVTALKQKLVSEWPQGKVVTCHHILVVCHFTIVSAIEGYLHTMGKNVFALDAMANR
ncbi:putative Ubiquitin-like domain superfamily, UBL3-like, ubiquitin domain-containing protein [Helianthus annuus]|nr:putative Ubiquitin-like domain superfamily, UBL3-like, ubiquitin domain-containing protein [Helianthus annuus]